MGFQWKFWNQCTAEENLIMIGTYQYLNPKDEQSQTEYDLLNWTEIKIVKQERFRNMMSKTKSHLIIFQTFLKTKRWEMKYWRNPTSWVRQIFLSAFFLFKCHTRKKNKWNIWAWTFLFKAMKQSINRYIKDKQYKFNIMNNDEFYKSCQT